jgi:hypothetical protein
MRDKERFDDFISVSSTISTIGSAQFIPSHPLDASQQEPI